MLARIAHELFWLGRYVARAEHTARMLDGVFQTDLAGSAEDPRGVELTWPGLLAILGARVEGPYVGRDEALTQLTLDENEPASLISCVSRAREGARTVRDVISADMWEVINTTHLVLQRNDLSGHLLSSPYSVYRYVKERSALFWGLTGRTMLRDEANSFLAAGGRIESADMVLRMLRVALPVHGDDEPRTGQAQALLQAVGGLQAFRRAVPAPPNAIPAARFLLYDRTYPDSVAASVASALRSLEDADPSPRNSAPVLRLSRLSAELEFRRRDDDASTDLVGVCEQVQRELALVDADIAGRYFATAAHPHDRHRPMNFSIRYLTEYRYDAPVTDNLNSLRVRPATNSLQRTDEFSIRVEPEARMSRYVDYFGTEVIEFGIAKPHDHLLIDVRARVVTKEQDEPPELGWDALADPKYREAAGEFLLPAGNEPRDATMLEYLDQFIDKDTPLAALVELADMIPNRFEYNPDATYVGSTVEDLFEAGGGVCQDFVHLGLILLRRRGIAARYVSGYLWAAPQEGEEEVHTTSSLEVETHAWLEALLPGEREPVWVGCDPTNRRLADESHVKIGHGRLYSDVPPIKGVYAGAAGSHLEANVTMSRLDPAASAKP